MGVMGVEGIFRRCCEFTMEVMRKQQDSILTLLEVLLYDPLYVWTVTPQKAAALQQKQKLTKRRGSAATDTIPDDGVLSFLFNLRLSCVHYFVNIQKPLIWRSTSRLNVPWCV